MELKDKNIGFVITGSFYNFTKIIEQIKKIKELDGNIIPIMSFNAFVSNTRFGLADNFINEIELITEKKIICDIQQAEEIGLNKETDILVVAPSTGNTIAKLANGITDNPATVAVKSALRNSNNIVVGIATNDRTNNQC